MKICVSGGCGFIGTKLCEKLLDLGHVVINIDALTYAANRKMLVKLCEARNYYFKQGDVRDNQLVLQFIRAFNCDAVIHLAAESHVDRSISGPQSFIDANVVGTYGVLEAIRAYLPDAPDGFRFVHVSTDEVFGDLGQDDPPFTEHSRYRPSSPYSASKAAADHLVRAWGRTYGLPYMITYGANAYGPGQLPDKLVPMCITNGLAAKPITINGNGENIRTWLHVDDHVDGLIAVLERGQNGEAYCLSSGEEISNIDMAKQICKLLDIADPNVIGHVGLITFTADRPGNDLRYAMDCWSTERRLGWAAKHELAESLPSIIQWYMDNCN